MPADYAIPELTAVSDAIAQAEAAGFNPLDPIGVFTIASVKNGKQALNTYVLQLDGVLRSCRDVPPALLSSYRGWRGTWDRFYNAAIWPWTVANDGRVLAAHQLQAGSFHDRLAEYCDVPEMPPVGGRGIVEAVTDPLGTAATTAKDMAEALKTVAIVGGVLALVLVVGMAYVASKTVPANIRAGADVLRR